MSDLAKSKQEIGQELIEIAAKQRDDEKKKQVLGFVRFVMQSLEESEAVRDRAVLCCRFFKRQLTAIDSGSFSIEPRTAKIIFDESELNFTSPQ